MIVVGAIPGFSKKDMQENSRFWLIYLCFFIFGMIIPFTKPSFSMRTFFISVFLSIFIGFLAVYILILIFRILNPHLLESNIHFAEESVGNGMLFMIPFVVLAIMAKFALGWNAITPFASTAITTAMAATGAEVMKKGAQGSKNVLIPSILAFVLSIVWMMISGILP